MTASSGALSGPGGSPQRVRRSVLAGLWFRYLAVTFVLGLVAVVLTWPYARLFSGSILGDASDVPMSARLFWALERQGGNPFATTRDLMLAAPEGVEVLRAVNLGNLLFTAPVWLAGQAVGFGEAFSAYGFVALVLSGTAAFILLDRLRFGVLAAAFGAYVFAFNPNHIDKAFGHAPLAATGILPLVLLALLAGRRNPTVLRAVGAGSLLAVAFYLNSYLGLFAFVLAAVFAVVDFLLPRQGKSRGRVALSYYFVALTFVVGLIPLGVSWYFDPSNVSSLADARSQVLQGGSAGPQLYLLPGPRHPWLGGPMSEWLETNVSWEYTMFFGYTTLGLAVAGVALAIVRKRRKLLTSEAQFIVVFAAALTVVGVWASLPTQVGVGWLEVPTPSFFIREVTTLYRVFSRFGVLVCLGLVILAAYALSTLPVRRHRIALQLGALALVAFELYVGPPKVVELEHIETPVTVSEIARSASSRLTIMRTSDPPSYLRWLRRQPPGLVADYPSPLAPDPRWAWQDAVRQQVHEHALWQSLENTKTSLASLRDFAADLDAAPTQDVLAVTGVEYVVVHRDRYEALGQHQPAPRCGFDLVGVFPSDDVAVYKVSARADQGFAVRDRGFHYVKNRKLWPENVGYRWMPERSEVLVFAPQDDDVFLHGSAVSLDRPRELDVLDSSGRQVGAWEISRFDSAFRFALQVRKGLNRFVFRARPGAVRENGDSRNRSIAVSPMRVEPIRGAWSRLADPDCVPGS